MVLGGLRGGNRKEEAGVLRRKEGGKRRREVEREVEEEGVDGIKKVGTPNRERMKRNKMKKGWRV
ncbi:hypothetical protein WN51_13347 [Melipona quadrifasciata]|uniref:Uncharacterized protein n=1 Tax=Melipona quadrifasciata TaxID=166423 RepID=A0A0M9A4N4_9HYME|nr:hypothetical protein WN51_13347 [Melipona quadrifasciata]